MQTTEDKETIIRTCIEKAEMCICNGHFIVPQRLSGNLLDYMDRGVNKTLIWSSKDFTFDYFEEQ